MADEDKFAEVAVERLGALVPAARKLGESVEELSAESMGSRMSLLLQLQTLLLYEQFRDYIIEKERQLSGGS